MGWPSGGRFGLLRRVLGFYLLIDMLLVKLQALREDLERGAPLAGVALVGALAIVLLHTHNPVRPPERDCSDNLLLQV
jgi:hypothetical protein